MSFYAIGEPECQSSNWYNDIVSGILKEKRRKRFTLIMLDSIDELEHHTITDEDVIFVIGTNSGWLSRIIYICEVHFHNRVILLSDHENRIISGRYSIVTSDIAHDIQTFYDYLLSCEKTRIALYGINPDSAADNLRKKSFLSCGATEEDLFYNSESLSKCFEDFARRLNDYDAVICVSNYAAISLIRFLNNKNHLFVASCGSGTLLTHFFAPSITHTHIDYLAFGSAAINICHILQNSESIDSINIFLESKLFIGETTNNIPLTPKSISETNIDYKLADKHYSDSEIDEMLRIETLLNSCDEEDFLLLDNLLNNMTYAQIAEKMYMSTNGVKYKTKKMFHICQVSTKNELIDLLDKYKR